MDKAKCTMQIQRPCLKEDGEMMNVMVKAPSINLMAARNQGFGKVPR